MCQNLKINYSECSFPESNLPPRVVRSFMGTTEEALKYLDNGFYLSLTGYLCKVSN